MRIQDDDLIQRWCSAARDVVVEREGLSAERRPPATWALAEALALSGYRNKEGRPLPENTVGNYCRGVTEVPLRVALAMARLTGLSLDRLAGVYGEPSVGPAPVGPADITGIENALLSVLSDLREQRRLAMAAQEKRRKRRKASGGKAAVAGTAGRAASS